MSNHVEKGEVWMDTCVGDQWWIYRELISYQHTPVPSPTHEVASINCPAINCHFVTSDNVCIPHQAIKPTHFLSCIYHRNHLQPPLMIKCHTWGKRYLNKKYPCILKSLGVWVEHCNCFVITLAGLKGNQRRHGKSRRIMAVHQYINTSREAAAIMSR